MRTLLRRLVVLGASLTVVGLLAPTPAHAGPCYRVYVDNQWVTICPYD